jgi:hypothetical protein
VAISAVGSLAMSNTDISTTGGAANLSFSPTNIGDILIFLGTCHGSWPSNVTSVTGGGVTTWIQLQAQGSLQFIDFWYGVVTALGASTITATQTSPGGSPPFPYLMNVQEFTGGSGIWSLDSSGHASLTASSGNYPSLTPVGANELYFAGQGNATATPGGSTSGFTYVAGENNGGSSPFSGIVYKLAASNPTAQSPAWTLSSSGSTLQVAALFEFVPSSLPPRAKGLPNAVRRANNYFKRESGLWEPERGFLVPRAA